MYNRAEKPSAVAARQSASECLSAVREETQQLEEELTTHQEVPRGTVRSPTQQGIHQLRTHTHTYKHKYAHIYRSYDL